MRVLVENYGIADAVVVPIERGHTNRSFAVTTSRGRFVLRQAWAGKPVEQIAREEHVLGSLGLPWVPRIVPTRMGTLRVMVDGRVYHLFEALPGEPGRMYLGPGDTQIVATAMSRLRELHAALPGWLHGDFHLGNLLWNGDVLTGVVDFDDAAPGPAEYEVAMALFALSRQPDEDTFRYDRTLWHAGLASYGDVSIEPEPHVRAFCEYQVRIHETAAARGLWPLTTGIGYWPCKRTLMRSGA